MAIVTRLSAVHKLSTKIPLAEVGFRHIHTKTIQYKLVEALLVKHAGNLVDRRGIGYRITARVQHWQTGIFWRLVISFGRHSTLAANRWSASLTECWSAWSYLPPSDIGIRVSARKAPLADQLNFQLSHRPEEGWVNITHCTANLYHGDICITTSVDPASHGLVGITCTVPPRKSMTLAVVS